LIADTATSRWNLGAPHGLGWAGLPPAEEQPRASTRRTPSAGRGASVAANRPGWWVSTEQTVVTEALSLTMIQDFRQSESVRLVRYMAIRYSSHTPAAANESYWPGGWARMPAAADPHPHPPHPCRSVAISDADGEEKLALPGRQHPSALDSTAATMCAHSLSPVPRNLL
jgi:hypothetical protein